MPNVLKDKRALVTGASKGIGLAIAQALHLEGAHVMICARDSAKVEQALGLIQQSPGGKVAGMAADVGRFADVEEMFRRLDQEFNGLDVLVNNAGFGIFHPAAEISVSEWDKLIATNLSGVFYCSKEALARFKRGNGGHIVNLSSLAGKNAFAGGAAYNASKFGLNGFSEAMMLDHRAENVRVSYVMPGSVDTGFSGVAKQQESAWKIAPEDIAEIVTGILKMPQRTLISCVEVRPSLPKKN